ncbi:MAG TPA: LuxR C-terminal-related transcriptional regulator [Candidatus Dormibacteraeota bacterium]|nr:LuxR C-terminal-related transcriptional regulator [Candidatus Dormibacteraeota bacterium]
MPPGPTQEIAVRLSPRELEVATMVAEGLTNRDIAAKLFISERTADGHLEHIREKLGVNTRAQVTAWVVRHESAPLVVPAPSPRVVVVPPGWALAHPRAWLAAALVLALLTAGVGVLRLTAPALPIIRTIAGSQCAKQVYPGGCYGGDNQRAAGAQLARPTSVAVDSRGVMYIADYGNHRIRKVVDGVITTIAGGGSGNLVDGALGISVSTRSLGYASAVAVDSHDRLYLLTSRTGVLEVWTIDTNGFMHSVVAVGSSNITISQNAPNLPVGGLAITKEGVLFIADRVGDRVMRFDGETSTYAGTGDRQGDGGAATSAQLSWPIGLALDKQENLYIADTGDNRIRRVDHAKGTITTVAGGAGEFEGNSGDDGPARNALLSFPFDVAVAPDGTIVFTDTGNHRIRSITPDGKIYAVAGTSRWGFAGDGLPASEAEFDGPEGLTLDSKGNLFIADTENQRVREIPHLFGAP